MTSAKRGGYGGAPITNFRKVGGWGEKSVRQIVDHGAGIANTHGDIMTDDDKPIEDMDLIERLTGAWVDYDQIPYQLADEAYERLRCGIVTDSEGVAVTHVYQLDREAVCDLIRQTEGN